jgi:DNA (cytosine-5)-methyltransferase 1
MKHGSLFSGIGGFDLASEWMGWENVFHCEWNPFGQKVLNHYWPNAITYHDNTKTDFTIHRGTIDIITGGFPCQPYSSAGKRLGKEDERHLWPEMLRAIREIQPTWIVGENVRGLTNWNGGLVFDEVQSDLETQGYEVTPFLLPAASVNAPHRRDRIWFIAFKNSNSNGWSSDIGQSQSCKREQRNTSAGNNERICANNEEAFYATNSDLLRCDKCIKYDEVNTGEGRINAFGNIDKGNGNGFITNSNGNRSTQFSKNYKSEGESGYIEKQEEWTEHSKQYNELSGFQSNASDSNGIGLRGQINRSGKSRFTNKKSKGNNWQNFPTVSPICDGNDGISDRLDRITFSKWRNESIKAGGNAIVPQVVYQIFKAIQKYNELNKQLTI